MSIFNLFAVDAGSAVDDEAKENSLVDVLNLRNLGDAAVLGCFLQVVLLALGAPDTEDDARLSFANLLADGAFLSKSCTRANSYTAAQTCQCKCGYCHNG